MDHRTKRLPNRSTKLDETVSEYLARTVKKVGPQMKAHFFDAHNLFSVFGFLSTFKRACYANCIYERAATLVLHHYVNETLANAHRSGIRTTNNLSSFAISVRNVNNQCHKRVRPYWEIVKYLLKKLATNHATAKIDATIPRYILPANTTAQKYADDLVLKSCNAAVDCYEGTLNDGFIEEVYS